MADGESPFSQLSIDGRPCREPDGLWAQLAAVTSEATAGLPPAGTLLTIRGKPRRVVMVCWHPPTARLDLVTETANERPGMPLRLAAPPQPTGRVV